MSVPKKIKLSMDLNLSGKKALVTGAGKGIGRAVAIRLSEFEVDVLAVSRTQADLDELSNSYPRIKTLCLDLSDWNVTKAAIEKVGPIDLLVNNAGILDVKLLGEISEEDIDKTFDVNFKAVLNVSQIIANGMKARGEGGVIVNVSSLAGDRGAPTMTSYSTSKASLDQLTRCMASEYGPHNIRVNSVNPTVIRTKMAANMFVPDSEPGKVLKARTPLGRLGEVDDISYPVLFLLSDKASLITGICLAIDGGFTAVF